MTISYALHPIKITGKAGDYQAIVHFTRSVGLEEVIERMIEQNPGLTRPLAQAMINGYHTAITSLALEGCKINTPTVNHGVSIKGLFDGPGDSFSPDRHQVLPTVSPGKELLRAMRLARTRKLPTRTPGPEPQEYNDLTSQSRDHRISPGQPAHLFGFALKFNPADPEQGIFFIAADNSATRVETVAHNKPGQLLFINPLTLQPGLYTLEVRAAFRKKLRRGQLPALLEVM